MSRAIPAEDFDHGDPKRYRRGCRCRPCVLGTSAQVRKDRYLRKTGRGTQRAPMRAADHILRLRAAGLDDRAIREQANICCDILYRILRREGTIHVRTERRILAVPMPQKTGSATLSRAYISALGTHRRLRTLTAAGWHVAELGRRLDRPREHVSYLVLGKGKGRVTMSLADHVRVLYDELHTLKPEDHGVQEFYAERARQHAAANDWAGPGYWDADDFDNPDFIPATNVKTTQAFIVAENAAWLLDSGLTRELAAARLGLSRFYIDRALREAARREVVAA